MAVKTVQHGFKMVSSDDNGEFTFFINVEGKGSMQVQITTMDDDNDVFFNVNIRELEEIKEVIDKAIEYRKSKQ